MAKSPGSKKGLPKQNKPATKFTKKSGNQTSHTAFARFIPLVILASTFIIVLTARIKLLAIPLERDEGGFAYIGHWLFNGRSLYTDFVDNKLPGLYTLYGLFTATFGYNSSGVHAGLLLSAIVTAICFYFLLDRLRLAGIARHSVGPVRPFDDPGKSPCGSAADPWRNIW